MTHSSTQNTPTQGHETNPTVRAPTGVVPRSVRLLGFWSGVGLAITYSLFDLGVIAGPSMLGILRQPWDPIIPIGASLLIAPSFLLLMISVHYAAPQPARIWSHAAISFATVYASLVSLVYVTWLFVVEPHVLNGTESQVELLVFKPGSFMQMVDGIGYTFMGVAAWFAAPCFTGPGLARWARLLSIVSGPAALLVFLAYFFYSFTLGLPAALLFPAYGLVLAFYFRTLTVGAWLDAAPKE
ncbi:MAG TPA: hypothetical protein VI094_11685 [Propionibacteriaceae bacterium]